MVARLGRHQVDGVGRDVRRVADEHVDPPPQRGRQGVVQVALEDSLRRQVAAGAGDRGRVELGGVHLGARHQRRDRGPDGAGAAAQVEDHGRGPGQGRGRTGEELGPAPRHEHARSDRDPQPAEARPADHHLQRQAGGPVRDHPLELVGRAGGLGQQGRLVLGEHAPGGAQPLDEAGVGSDGGHGVGAPDGGGSMIPRRRSQPRHGVRAGVLGCGRDHDQHRARDLARLRPALGRARRVAGRHGMHRIPLPLPMDGLRAVNVYAIETEDGLTLIDGGWAIEEAGPAGEVARPDRPRLADSPGSWSPTCTRPLHAGRSSVASTAPISLGLGDKPT